MEKESSTERITLRPLSRFNWETAAELEVHEYQEDFLPSNLHSLAQSRFEDLEPLGIYAGDSMVGFLMYGNFSGICWINRVMIDKRYQEKGYGRRAVGQLLKKLNTLPGCDEIRTSFAKSNALAEYFFSSLGFSKKGEPVNGEIVMQYQRSRPN